MGVDLDDVPVADGRHPAEALGGGEDYELVVATGAPTTSGGVRGGRPDPAAAHRPVHRPTRGVTLGGEPLPPVGWRHRF